MRKIEDRNAGSKRGHVDTRLERAEAIVDEIRSIIASDPHHEIAMTALDFGCGSGLVGLPLRDLFGTMVFLDASPERTVEMERKLSGFGTQRATALCYDIMTMPPLDFRFDYIIASLVLHQIADTDAVLERLYRMLRDDGRLIIVDFDKNREYYAHFPGFSGHKGFEHADLIERLTKAGFSRTEARTFYRSSIHIDEGDVSYSLFALYGSKPASSSPAVGCS